MKLETIENAIKNIYLDVIADALNNCHPFLSQVRRSSDDVWGKEIRKFEKIKADDYVVLRTVLENVYIKCSVPDKALQFASIGACVDLINDEMQTLLNGGKIKMSEYLMKSFDTLFSTSDVIYGVPKDAHPKFYPCVQSQFGELTEDKLKQIIDCFAVAPNFIITAYEIRDHIKTFSDCETIELQNGTKAYYWNGIVVTVDTDCPDGTMFILNSEDFKNHQLCDWQWLQDDNGHILRKEGKCYTATLVKYQNLTCSNPSNQIKLTGIVIPKESNND